MKVSVLVLLFGFISLAFAQDRIDRIIIDDFLTGDNSIVITIPADASFPIQDSSIFTDVNASGLLGGERDLILVAQSGSANRIMVSQVNEGEWNIATPNSASGFARIQWDGPDNSINLNPSGLNVDLSDNGLGEEFHAIIETDIDTEYRFTVTSPGGGQCSLIQEIPGDQSPRDYYLPFSSFSSGCDFSNVGAVEIQVEAFDNVDSIMFLFAVSGVADPSNSVTPSPAPPSPPPSPSRSPVECMCMCPIFTCGLIYAQPGDDDDTVDDDTYDDDDLVFRPVYYGPGDDDFDNVIPDDDENEFFSFEGGLTIDANDDDDVATTRSSASALVVPVLIISAIALVL